MAEERVKIAEIDIGVDKILSKAASTKKQIAELQKSQKSLKKETDNLTNASQEQLEQYTLGEIELKKYKKEVRDSQKVLDAYINIQNQDIRTKDQARDANRKLIAIANQLDATNEDQAETLQKVNAEIDRNTDFIKENASEYEKTKINIGNYKESIKDALGELGIFGEAQQKVNQVTKAAGPIINFVSTNLKQIKTDYKVAAAETTGMSKAQIAAHLTTTALSSALKVLRVALIATGIGAFVVILGSLITYLASTQEGIDKVNRVLTPLKEIFAALLGLVQDFGKEIFEAVSNPKQAIKDLGEFVRQNLINRFEGFLNILRRIRDFDFDGIGDDIAQAGTGVVNASEKVRNLGKQTSDFFATAAARGREMADLQIEIEKGEVRLIELQSEYEKQIKEQNKIAEDQTKSQQEREAAARRSIQLSEELVAEQNKQLDMEIELAQKKTEANDTSREDEKALAELQAQRNANETRALELQTTQQNKLNTIRNQIESEKKAAHQEALQRQNELFEAELKRNNLSIKRFELEQGYAKKSATEQLAIAEEVYRKQLDIENKKLEAGKISQEELNLFILEKQQELARMQAEIAVDAADRELEKFKENHQRKIEANQFLNEELFQQERNRLNAIADQEREFQATRLEQGLIDQQEYNDAINAINSKNYEDQEKLRQERADAEKEKEAFELQLQRELEMERFQNQFEIERARAEQRYQAEIAEAEKLGANKAAIEAKYAEIREKINEAETNNKISLYAHGAENFAKILGEQTAAGKAASIAQTTIDTYQAAQAAYKALAGIPVVGPALGAAAAGAAVVSGLQNVRKITSTKVPKAEKGYGMDIEGPSHSQGGVKLYDGAGNPLVEAQGGERMVILKREASKELAALSAINQKHGGVSLSKPVSYAANGGAIIRSSGVQQVKVPKQVFDYDRLGTILADSVNSVQTVVPVDGINDVNYRNAKVQQRANL